MLIGIVGSAGSGKDEFGKIAIKEFDFKRADFSDTLKNQLREEFLDIYDVKYRLQNLYGSQANKEENIFFEETSTVYPQWFYDFLKTYGKEKYDGWKFNMRSLMQYYGTEVYRNTFGENYWVDKTLSSLDPNFNYVCCSVRFINEAKAIKNKGGIIVKINRPSAPIISNMNHTSETELNLIKFDYWITNNGTLEEYHNKIKFLLKELTNG